MDKQFFLGTNTGSGFYSLFDTLTAYDGDWRTYVIKGGPGTGKSGLMKKIADRAQQEGLYCERILCSSDPQSLDAVYIPEKKVSVCDGTAPHIVEPKFAGAAEQIVNIGALWNSAALKRASRSVMQLTQENQACHKRVSRLLGAATQLKTDAYTAAGGYTDMQKLAAFADTLAQKIPMRSPQRVGTPQLRFLSGVTPQGVVTFFDTVKALADEIVVLYDDSGFVSAQVLDCLAQHALANGYQTILCKDFLLPEKNAHLLLPELSLAVVTSNADCTYVGKAAKKLSASRFAQRKAMYAVRAETDFDRETITQMLNESVRTLAKAKEIHDDLEAIYIRNMDFEALDVQTQTLLREIFR